MIYRTIKFLGNKHAGFILCMIVVINLAAGSLVMNMYPKIYPPFFPFNLNFFFQPVQTIHWWLYALMVTFGLLSINLAACFIESIVRLKDATTGKLRLYAGLLLHGAILLTLVAHIHDGFYGDSDHMMLTTKPTTVPGVGTVIAKSVNNQLHPDGSLKDTLAELEFQLEDGTTHTETIAYNEPALFDGGRREIIIQGGKNQPAGVALISADDGQEFSMLPYKPVAMAGGRLTLQGVYESRMDVLIAQFVWERISQQPQMLTIALSQHMTQHNKLKLNDQMFGYKAMITEPTVAVMTRYNPSVPIILISLLIATIGTVLLIQYARIQSKRA
ncbi:hypothetical protein MNBD_GAMMA26-2305 [hydrothermal vent metagenome]|uniref:ResB-like domain-containing protein n=1 Tax=hydrothermal vent metagenome TaxID=652676 RepID=A0A3B1B4R8_9ZZZZ